MSRKYDGTSVTQKNNNRKDKSGNVRLMSLHVRTGLDLTKRTKTVMMNGKVIMNSTLLCKLINRSSDLSRTNVST